MLDGPAQVHLVADRRVEAGRRGSARTPTAARPRAGRPGTACSRRCTSGRPRAPGPSTSAPVGDTPPRAEQRHLLRADAEQHLVARRPRRRAPGRGRRRAPARGRRCRRGPRPARADTETTVEGTRLHWPRNEAVNAVAGWSYRSSGRPSCSIRPAFITATVSAMVMASSWSWVTWMNVRPTSVWIRLSSTCICRRSLRSSAPSGSSSRSTSGRLTTARARATRCCMPPDSCDGFFVATAASSTSSRASMARALASATLRRRSPNITLSSTSRCGNSA